MYFTIRDRVFYASLLLQTSSVIEIKKYDNKERFSQNIGNIRRCETYKVYTRKKIHQNKTQ